LSLSLAPLLAQVELREHDPNACPGNNGLCPGWMLDHLDRYGDPTGQHLVLVLSSVGLGFAIAFGLAILSHRQRWLVPPILGATGVLYTVPSIAFFFLLLPITGRGKETAIIALTAYSLQIIYRNIVAGLSNVPADAKESGRGMGMTDNQLFWRVELPLAMPELVAGLRIATVSTVALATLAVFAGGGGLGDPIYHDLTFKGNIVVAGGIAILMALAFDALLVLAQRRLLPWRTVKPV
jgi:osmoprotectant transport system permease protein